MVLEMDSQTTNGPAVAGTPIVHPLGYDPTLYDIGLRAFERDLPELMKLFAGQWVIYHGERRFGPSKSYQELDQACQREGVRLGERVCRNIKPEFRLELL